MNFVKKTWDFLHNSQFGDNFPMYNPLISYEAVLNGFQSTSSQICVYSSMGLGLF